MKLRYVKLLIVYLLISITIMFNRFSSLVSRISSGKLLLLSAMILLSHSGYASRLVVDSQTYNSTFNGGGATTINFSGFNETPVLVLLPTVAGGDPSSVRISSINSSQALVYPSEPRRQDGPHVAMQSISLAIEPGSYLIENTTTSSTLHLEAGTIDTLQTVSAANSSSWEQVTFDVPFDAPPVVVANIQTANNEVGEGGTLPPQRSSVPWMTTVIRNITTTGFEVALERSEAHLDGGTVSVAETIGFVAMDAGSGNFDADGTNIVWAGMSASVDTGYQDRNSASQIPYPTSGGGSIFSNPPLVVAAKTTRNENDGGWFRLQENTASFLRLTTDEDRESTGGGAGDNERQHGNETASIIAFSESFVFPVVPPYPPTISLQKTLENISDPINGTNNAKSIPGAIIEYSLKISNESPVSPDTNTITLNDKIPDNSTLVAAPAGYNCGAVNFVDGAPSSGLACSAANISFSDDGSSYSGTASPTTEYIRINPQGEFQKQSSGGSAPNAEFKFQVQLAP